MRNIKMIIEKIKERGGEREEDKVKRCIMHIDTFKYRETKFRKIFSFDR